jgi:succinate-semialdehyde dehydrogenase/glutarate-semialdehyde dehydrogenase
MFEFANRRLVRVAGAKKAKPADAAAAG